MDGGTAMRNISPMLDVGTDVLSGNFVVDDKNHIAIGSIPERFIYLCSTVSGSIDANFAQNALFVRSFFFDHSGSS